MLDMYSKWYDYSIHFLGASVFNKVNFLALVVKESNFEALRNWYPQLQSIVDSRITTWSYTSSNNVEGSNVERRIEIMTYSAQRSLYM